LDQLFALAEATKLPAGFSPEWGSHYPAEYVDKVCRTVLDAFPRLRTSVGLLGKRVAAARRQSGFAERKFWDKCLGQIKRLFRPVKYAYDEAQRGPGHRECVAQYTDRTIPVYQLKRLRRGLRDLATAPAPAPDHADGSVPPNRFRYRGKEYGPIARGPFVALDAAWPEDGHCIHKDDLAVVFDPAARLLADNTIPSIRGELNDFFRHHKIPYHATVRENGLYLAIQDGPPRAAARRARPKRKASNRATAR